jgi:glycosyltransferase involved in cell wall biosynthesis
MFNTLNIANVTVVIPCYRCSLTIERAIDSILSQTKIPAEVILVDDCSGDDTLNVLREIEIQHKGWIKVAVHNDNLGAASARNTGWSLATQPYVAFLDADDAWHSKKIEIQYNYMISNPNIVLCGHEYRRISQDQNLPNWQLIDKVLAKPVFKFQLLLSNKFVTPSIMLRRNIKQRFVENQRHMEDHMLWLEIVCSGELATKLSIELAAIYKAPFGETGLSSQMWLMEKADLNNYISLLKMNYINYFQYLIFSTYSLAKFMRRILICFANVLLNSLSINPK